MLLSIFIIQCLILVMLFIMYGTNSKKEIHTSTTDNLTDREVEMFRNGLKQTWVNVNVSLYKMYEDLDILDFDSIHEKLYNTIQDLTNNPDKLKTWAKKYNEYIIEKEGEKE